MMTKQHFQNIAGILRENRPVPNDIHGMKGYDHALKIWERITRDLCVYFQSENPRFNLRQFLEATDYLKN